MNGYKEKYQDFIKRYIEDHSEFQKEDLVLIKNFHTNQEYKITKVEVDSNGDFQYEATSPRTHSILPMLFKSEALEKYQNAEKQQIS